MQVQVPVLWKGGHLPARSSRMSLKASCKPALVRKEFERHMSASNQQHLLLVMTALHTLKQQSREARDETRAQFRVVKKGVSKVVDHLLQSCTPTQIAPLQSIKELVSGGSLRNVGSRSHYSTLSSKTELSNLSCVQTSSALDMLIANTDRQDAICHGCTIGPRL